METKEQMRNESNPVVPSNEFDLKRTEIRCRDDLAMKRLEIKSKALGIPYAIIWAFSLIEIARIIAERFK